MAIYNSLALGKARKSAGNVRFSIWKGIPVASQKPTSVANPRTIKQLNARARLSVLVSVFRSMPSVIDAMYGFRAIKQSPYNAFISANNIAANIPVSGSPPVAIFSFLDFVLVNKEQLPYLASVSPIGADIDVTFSNLPPLNDFTLVCGIGNQTSKFAQSRTSFNFSSDSAGFSTVSVTNFLSLVPDYVGVFFVIQNNLTGQIFSFKIQL